MLNFKLAKKLKDKGFPSPNEVNAIKPPFRGYWNHENEGVYIPILEELIEACGIEFASLRHCYKNKKGIWDASAVFGNAEAPTIIKCEAETHCEAVAKLWFELNKFNED